jgi:CDP-glucose 4,6-dehydratase
MIATREFWQGKRVLVTGHTGFKGAWLCHWLLRMGSEVMGYALAPPTTPSLFDVAGLDRQLRHHEGDVRDLDSLRASVESFRPEIAFHLAAQSLVLESYRAPVGTFATNVMGTANVLEALRSATDLRGCVVVTSDKCYADEGTTRAHQEEDTLGGRDPYSASKACAELVVTACRASFFGGDARIVSARAGNVVGGGDWSDDRLVPDIVRALTGATPLELRRPDAVRPWQHVLEPLGGYLHLAERVVGGPAFEGAWNFGPDDEEPWPVRDVVDAFVRAWNPGSETSIRLSPSTWRETAHLALDSSKARELLGWVPRWSVRQAIDRTVSWYRAFYEEGIGARELVEADLDAYEAAQGRHSATEVEASEAAR